MQSISRFSDVGSGEFLQDPLVPAVLAWGQYRSAFQLSNLEINAATASIANAAELGNILGERLEGSVSKMVSVINADLFAGTGTDGSGNPNIIGLNTAILNSGSYATIDPNTYPEWVGNVVANGGTARPLTMDLLYNLEQQIFTASGMEPDALVCSPGVYRKYAGLFEATRRTVDDGRGPIPTYQGAASNLFWKGLPVIRDRNATSGTLYMLNQGMIETRLLPFAMVQDGVLKTQKDLPSSNGMESASTALTCQVYPLGRTGSGVKFVAETYLQLKVVRRNAHGILKDISET